LNEQVAAADLLLAVVGPRWSELLAARKNDNDDFVVVEIKAALSQSKRVIPVLVGGSGMPHVESLPDVIRPLARYNAVELRPARFEADCQGLIKALKEELVLAVAERAARTEAERAAIAASRRSSVTSAGAGAIAVEVGPKQKSARHYFVAGNG